MGFLALALNRAMKRPIGPADAGEPLLCDEATPALVRSMRRWNGGERPDVFSPAKETDMQDLERTDDRRERGERASFDPVSGEVHGSGSGAGGGGNRDEDYDSDPMAGSADDPAGAPRPRSAGIDRPIDPDEGI